MLVIFLLLKKSRENQLYKENYADLGSWSMLALSYVFGLWQNSGHSGECGKNGLFISRKKGDKGNAKVLKSPSRACPNDLTSFYQHLSSEG